MTEVPLPGGFSDAGGGLRSWWNRVPAWAVLAYSLGIFLAFSPNVIVVSGIHNDYEMLQFKSSGFFHSEAEQLLSVARPVAALLTNLPILPLHSLADFRWSRLFSLLTICLIGVLMMAICTHRLRVRTQDAVAIALASFLCLPFIYSVLQPAAWAPHLVAILIAFSAYHILSRSNFQALSFLTAAARKDVRLLGRQALLYSRIKPVWIAGLIFQLALYDYPPDSLVIAAFPVIVVLFSQAPRTLRLLFALRDIAFLGVSLVIYVLSAKLIYLPIIRLLLAASSDDWRGAHVGTIASRIAPTYDYSFNSDVGGMLTRLRAAAKVSGDLWFLPQANFHLCFAASVVIAVLIAAGLAWRADRQSRGQAPDIPKSIEPLRLGSWTSGMPATVAVVATCFVLACAPVLASKGGIVTYRTVPVPAAIAAIVFIYAVRVVAETIGAALGNASAATTAVADVAVALTLGAALASNFYINESTMRLSRNEFAYVSGIVRQAFADNSSSIVLIDPRPLMLPEDIAAVSDQRGRAVPPFELGCFSGYCLQTGAIVKVAARELGYDETNFRLWINRGGDPIPGLTCGMLAGPQPSYPPNASQQSIFLINQLRTRRLTCVTYSLAWHDLDFDRGG